MNTDSPWILQGFELCIVVSSQLTLCVVRSDVMVNTHDKIPPWNVLVISILASPMIWCIHSFTAVKLLNASHNIYIGQSHTMFIVNLNIF